MNYMRKNKNVLLSILILALFVIIGEAALAAKPKTVELIVDEETTTIETTAKTVEEAVLEQGYSLDEIRVKQELDRRIKDHLEIELNTKKEIVFNNQGTLLNVITYTNTVSDFLKENDINVDEDDNVSPELNSKLKNLEEVTYDNIEITNYSKKEAIKYKTKKELTFDLDFGKTKVKVEGKNGEKQLDYTKVTKNDELLHDDLVKETVLKEATEKVILVGTKEVVKEEVEPKLVEKSNDTMYKGETNVIEEGSKGLIQYTYKNDGKTRKLVDEKIIKKASDRVVEYGTKSKAASSSSEYSLGDLQFDGVIHWGGKKFTYYSQQVLPGGGLRIPGRHVNAGGFVADADGYIVLANDDPKGTIVSTPFGYMGKVYDRGTYGNHYDVYTR